MSTNNINAQQYELPKLNYEYKSLEPFIDGKTMEIHHQKHHQGYVNNLNLALKDSEYKDMTLEDMMIKISHLGVAIRNNGGGHYNHSLFWEILSPNAVKIPEENLKEHIIKEFGSVEGLKEQLNKAASTRFGSGWAWLIYTKEVKLKVVSTANQDNPLMDTEEVRGIPILGIDVWEHAYYLKYQNKRPEYLSQIWQVIDWEAVSSNYENAKNSELLKKL